MNIETVKSNIFNHSLSDQPISSHQGEIDELRVKIAHVEKLWREYGKGEGSNSQALQQELYDRNNELQKLCAKVIPLSLDQEEIRNFADYALASCEQLKWLETDNCQENLRPPPHRMQPAEVSIPLSNVRVIRAKGDGNCALRAIAKSCYPTSQEEKVIEYLRKEVVQKNLAALREEIETAHYEKMYQFYNMGRGDSSLREDLSLLSKEELSAMVDNYETMMEKSGEYIGEFELNTLSQIIDKPIEIYRLSDANDRYERIHVFGERSGNSSSCEDSVKLLYGSGLNHYDLLT